MRFFVKKLFFFFMCLFLIPIFAACGSNKNNESTNNDKNNVSNSSTENKTEDKKANLSLVGNWKSEDEKDSSQEATITKDKIEIRWVNHKDNVESLTREGKEVKIYKVEGESEEEVKQKLAYWVGTYKAPETSQDKYLWISEINKDALNGAQFATDEKTKEFKYENGILSYKITVPGTNTVKEIKLKRV